MLRYDHSSKILEGLFESITETDAKGNPAKDTEDELKYRRNAVMFPTPGQGFRNKVSLNYKDSIGSLRRYTYSRAFSYGLYTEGQKFTVYFDGVAYKLEPYYSVTKKRVYLGNAELLPDELKDPQWSGYDQSFSFAVVISNFYKDGDEVAGKYSSTVNFYGIYDATSQTITEEIGVIQHPEVQIFVGLFNINPNEKGVNFTEPMDDNNEWWPEYLRPRLNTRSRFDKNINMLAPAKINSDGYAEIATQDMLLFPESVGNPNEDLPDSEAGWGHISGFGLFYENTRYKTVYEETLAFTLSKEKDYYSASFALDEVPVLDQKYNFYLTQITGFSAENQEVVKQQGSYIKNGNFLAIGSIEEAEAETKTKFYFGRCDGDKIELRISKEGFRKYLDDKDQQYATIEAKVLIEDESIPFLWGDIKGKDKDGNETEGVDLERYQVPVIRKSGLTFTLK